MAAAFDEKKFELEYLNFKMELESKRKLNYNDESEPKSEIKERDERVRKIRMPQGSFDQKKFDHEYKIFMSEMVKAKNNGEKIELVYPGEVKNSSTINKNVEKEAPIEKNKKTEEPEQKPQTKRGEFKDFMEAKRKTTWIHTKAPIRIKVEKKNESAIENKNTMVAGNNGEMTQMQPQRQENAFRYFVRGKKNIH